MDLSEKSSSEDHVSYHPWQQFDPSSIENHMNSSSSSVSVFDSYCSGFYSQQTNSNGKALPMGGWSGQGILPPSLSQFPADPSFVERAARFSCFNGGGSFITAVANPVPFAVSDAQNPRNDGRDIKNDEETAAAELSGDGQENSSSGGGGSDSAKKRKRGNQDMELEQVQRAENSESMKKWEKNSSKPAGKNVKGGADGAKDQDYIHVRARRGQATNSHSLAERVRREKISERMKYLQDLVPGCSKVTGKAVMLDEIINYVQSLQRQVEFLSMKLATVNPRLDANIEGLLSKDLLNLRGGSTSATGFLPEMIHSQLHPSQQGLVQGGMANPSDALRRAINAQLTSLGTFKEPLSQMPNAWEDELHNIVQMNFGSNPPFNVQELNAKPRDGFPL